MVSDIFPTGPTYFKIQLQNDTFQSYVAGQTIIGRVVVELRDKLKIMALKIELVGKGVVQWEKEHYFVDNRSSRSRRPKKVPDEETYIFQEKYLIGERAEAPVTLPPGVHSFAYFFTLSPWLPSSFEGRHCHIRYSLQATLERSLFKDLKSEPLKFLIKGILDLNQYPAIQRPVNVTEHKNRDLLCWKLWSVALNLNIDKTGYIPGELLKFSVKLNNSCSNVRLSPVKAYLIQKVTVKAPRAECSYEQKISKVQGPSIDAGEIDTWEGKVEIPHVEPSGLGLYPSQVLRFNIQYFIKVAAKNVFSTISRKVGLTIGTIPIRDTSSTSASSTVGVGSDIVNSNVITFGSGPHQQFTPYKNLSEVFPHFVGNNANASNNISSSVTNLTATQNGESNNANLGGDHNDSNNQDGSNVSNSVPVTSPLYEQPHDGISTSSLTIVTLADNSKLPLKRTDTPPPSYEEAIKKPPGKKL